MKKIVVYIVRNANHTTIEPFCNEIAENFRLLGEDVFKAYTDDVDSVQQAVDLMYAGEVKFSIGLNNFAVSEMCNREGMYIYDDLDVPHVSWLLDAPYNTAIGKIDFPCNRHFVCCLDKTHIELLPKLFPHKKFYGSLLLPLPGMSCVNERNVFNIERDIDVLYCGSTEPLLYNHREWHNNSCMPAIASVLDDVVDYLMSEPVSIYDGVKHVLEARGMYEQEYLCGLLPYFFLIFLCVKHTRRIKAMELLVKNDIQVDIYGRGWENTAIYNSPWGKNMRLHGAVSYDKSLELTARSKIIFQDQAEFNNGGHDRVFTGMLSGAAVVSEYSSYLANKFIPNEEIFLYDWKNGMQQINIIHELLEDESKRLAATVKAYGKANKNHHWINRCQNILEAMEIRSMCN